ncbi:F-box domain [Arabidopsis thaliana x Arabidopsis arenosa]|uniref:F-box domain n=1 Tax=Arabidopsis thaliana x Arabidopsis arenosa TaxID=1240361 RepID=A0A8T1Z2N4_9BRAS|nr:F-box domain [Arabidopsis thaliana x Arabidopsis arenosa]
MGLRLPSKVLEHILSFIDSNEDRNSVSLVCKSWFETERKTRKRVFVGNCYAVSPAAVAKRFPEMRSLTLKGKPHFADYNLVPDGWGGYAWPWIEAMAAKCPSLEEIRLKRMVVTDECLEKIAASFKDFEVLVLTSCEGFSTDGIAAIAATCRNLRVLELRECIVEDLGGDWLSYFPETSTSLVSLDFSCLDSEVKISDLERLVSRSPNLKSLKLNPAVTLDGLVSLLRRAPQLTELGTGSFAAQLKPEAFSKLSEAFSNCKQLQSLSGLWDVLPEYLPALYSVCPGLTSLNLSYATVRMPDLVELLRRCSKLQKLWVMDLIEDKGLEAVASYCKELQELRVFPSAPDLDEANIPLTEQGLVFVSKGCRKLESVLYFCVQFTNAALLTIARKRPNLKCFRLCVIEPFAPDYKTNEPLDKGFKAIAEGCKDLRRLSVSGLLSDKAFKYIGKHAKKVRMLSIAFAGDSDLMLHHLLSGCESLKKLEIRDCPFGDTALLEHAAKLETMRSLWMSSCFVSFGACKILSQKMPRLNVEVIDEHPPETRPESSPVERIYIYRTVAGPRMDTPEFVWTIHKNPEIGVSHLAIK